MLRMLYVAIAGRSQAAVILSGLMFDWIIMLVSLSLSKSEMFPSNCGIVDTLQGLNSKLVNGGGGVFARGGSCFLIREGGSPPSIGFPG